MTLILIVIKITIKDQFEHIVTPATIPQNVDVIKRKVVDSKLLSKSKLIGGLNEIHTAYQGFLIDVWGVLHDGCSLYPHALECINKLLKYDKKIIILSNAARRTDVMIEELRGQEILPNHYHTVLSSGELTWQAIQKDLQAGNFYGRLGYYLGPERSRGLIDGLNLDWVDDIAKAEFILNTGTPHGNPQTTIDSDSVLNRAAELKLPMICANPDRIAIRAGLPGICAGTLANRYEELGGGEIQYFGKPYPSIYIEAMAKIGLPASKVLAIGDAFETDIRGGQNAGLDTCLIAAGIHRQELLPLSRSTISAATAIYTAPDYICEHLAW